jgi:hypothetical protein
MFVVFKKYKHDNLGPRMLLHSILCVAISVKDIMYLISE